MDERYDSYCAADRCSTTRSAAPGTARLPGRRPADRRPGWRREPHDDWLIYVPDGARLPQQGWKIHVSAGLDNAERVLDAVWDYCVPAACLQVPARPARCWLRNSKYAAAGLQRQVHHHLPARRRRAVNWSCKELGELLTGEPGPYILSDLRWGAGPLYVRYGGFAARYCVSTDGQVVPAIADDDRHAGARPARPVFHVPPGSTLPDFLGPHLAARNAAPRPTCRTGSSG